jgi:serine phosphatase RsbU (regulator of sigma subunit)/anti-sigma regulatory factor (Ser/Thr protein kinase)
VVAQENRPLRLTQAQVEQHPAWKAPAPGEQTPLRGLLAVPLIAWDGANLGVIQVSDPFDGDFTDADENLLVQLAQIASAAVESTRQYAREHAITEALQRNLLPQRLPPVDAIELSARYVPAAIGDRVGGDWYDVIPLVTGEVALVVGDVAGHGSRAAAMMGQVRNAVRVYALEQREPDLVLNGVSQFLPRLDAYDMVTLIYVVFDPQTGGVRYATAGHPPPLLLGPEGQARYLNGGGQVPLGVAPHLTYEQRRDALAPGATLVLYTDGLVEDPSESLEDGLARLARATEAAPSGLDALCDHVLGAVTRGRERDDVAILAARHLAMASTPLRLEVAAQATMLAPMRRTLGRWLKAVGAGEDESFEIIVACSEASANAIEHAYGPGKASFTIDLSFEGGSVVVVVRDHGRWRPPRGENRGRGQQLMAALMDRADTVADERGTEVRMVRTLTGEPRARTA